MLQGEALLIKEQLAKSELDCFNASNGWVQSFKKAHGIRECWISGVGKDVSLVNFKAWLEELPDIATP